MKLYNFYVNDKIHVGVESNGAVADLTAAGLDMNMNQIIAEGEDALDRIKALCEKGDLQLLALEELSHAPITEPGKILCVGLNYKQHAKETNMVEPKKPILFSKFNDALCQCGKDIELKETAYQYDYEAELVIVVGKTAENVTVEEGWDSVFGYTCGNDLSAREAQMASGQWLIGKTFPNFAPAGPCIVTADCFNPLDKVGIYCYRNGVEVQGSTTDDMIFNAGEVISYASKFMRLNPGDLIFTGTPAGVILGYPEDKKQWVKKGEVLEIVIDGIGTLKNKMV